MPRFQPLGRPAAGAPPSKVVMRRGPDGRLHIVLPERELKETTEAAERPPTPDDPRTGPMRNIPPYGGGV